MSTHPVYQPKAWEPIAKADLIEWVQGRALWWYRSREAFIDPADQAAYMDARRKYMETRSVEELLVEILETFPEEEFGHG